MTDSDAPDDDEPEYDDDEPNCQTCGGDGIDECDDILGCMEANCNGDFHTCPNCRGSGMAKDQWYW